MKKQVTKVLQEALFFSYPASIILMLYGIGSLRPLHFGHVFWQLNFRRNWTGNFEEATKSILPRENIVISSQAKFGSGSQTDIPRLVADVHAILFLLLLVLFSVFGIFCIYIVDMKSVIKLIDWKICFSCKNNMNEGKIFAGNKFKQRGNTVLVPWPNSYGIF